MSSGGKILGAPSNGSLMYDNDLIICLNSTWNGSNVYVDCPINHSEKIGGLKIYSEYEIIWTPDVIQRVASLCVIIAMTIVGNTLILIVLTCSKYRKINSRVNIFIINLAIGDLGVCVVTMTTEILFVAFGEWLLGSAGCKLTTYAQIVTLASTTFILTAMSFDRYLAICKPLSLGTGNSRGKKMIIVAWTLAFIFAIPQLFIFIQVQDGLWVDGRPHYSCKSRGYTAFWQRKTYFTALTLYILIIPAILISFFYVNIVRVVWQSGRELSTSRHGRGSGTTIRKCVGDKRAIPRARVKTIKMTLSIIITFIACWCPYFVTHLIRIYSEYEYEVPKVVMAFVETIALLQSALNPILYGCFNIKLKRGLLEVFCPSKVRQQQNQNGYNANYSCRSIGLTDYASISEAHYPDDVYSSKRHSDKCKNGLAPLKNPKSEPRLRTKIIAETNKNGFRLRVRFLSRLNERRASSDRREGVDKPGDLPVTRMTLPTIVVQKPDSSSSKTHDKDSEPQSAASMKAVLRPSTSNV